jgi:hypothetical protein
MTAHNPLSRRSALARLAGASAAVAVAGGTALAAVTPDSDGLDWPATILRAERVVERLKKYYGTEWSSADEEAAAAMLKHIRDHGPEDDEDGLEATLDFMDHYNQSFDWVFRGEPVTMITDAASCSPRGEPTWVAAMAAIIERGQS